MGGPAAYSQACGGEQSVVLQMHARNGDMGDLGERFVRRFDLVDADAGLPADPALRAALHAYMRWAVDDVLSYLLADAGVAAGVTMSRWGWDGLQA
jgi:hemoglobin